MKRSSFITSGLVLLLFSVSQADTLFTCESLDYTVYLPDNWVMKETSNSQNNFVDTTGTYPGLLGLVRYARNSVDFPTSEEWTRAHFIAYKLTAEHSADPWGAVLYYDSTKTSKQQNLWAPEAYTMFFSVDTTLGNWAEYIRYTASGDYGYELYALSDTADLLKNVGLYAAILQGIELPEDLTQVIRHDTSPARSDISRAGSQVPVDMMGRRILMRRGAIAVPRVYAMPKKGQTVTLP